MHGHQETQDKWARRAGMQRLVDSLPRCATVVAVSKAEHGWASEAFAAFPSDFLSVKQFKIPSRLMFLHLNN